jgi:hypothetical protein
MEQLANISNDLSDVLFVLCANSNCMHPLHTRPFDLIEICWPVAGCALDAEWKGNTFTGISFIPTKVFATNRKMHDYHH